MTIRLKRVYDSPSKDDGMRILVDRIWPRGLKKEEAKVDLWLKDLAPSTALRQWFRHEPKRWTEFRRRYQAELKVHDSELGELRRRGRSETVTLLFAARDLEHNNAVALREFLNPH